MSSSRSSCSLYLIPFLLLLMIQTVIGADPLFHTCSNNYNFTHADPYDTNLRWLKDYLSSSTPLTGFSLGSLGRTQDQPHGLALCRGDVSANDCKICVRNATVEIANLCPYNKAVTIWYDNCLLKYSNEDFFGHIDTSIWVYLINVQNASDPDTFNNKVKELFGELKEKASGDLIRMFGSGEKELSKNWREKIYGMVQCTRDLSGEECKKCVEIAMGQLPTCCSGKIGGRVIGGSCIIRYETYPFVSV